MIRLIFVLLLAGFLASCGTETGSGAIEPDPTNAVPPGGSTPGIIDGNLRLKSAAFSTAIIDSVKKIAAFSNYSSVDTFKLCVSRIRMIANDDTWIYKDGSKEIEISAGLIDLSSGMEKTWGSFNVPTGFTMERLRVLVKKDTTLCNQSYSVIFNGVSTEEEAELRWRFDPPASIVAGDAVKLSLTAIVAKIKEAASQSGFNGDALKKAIESVEASASEE